MVNWIGSDETCPQCGKVFHRFIPMHPWWWNDEPYCSKSCRDAVANREINAILRRQNIADEKERDGYTGA